ncbi:hypothetical protein DY218_23325 [Streptomyces triticagri]|uniref:Hydrogenase expression protein HypF n=1 Tax=Streptomyces triticagri TaxID=2293568 RepID=A0A372M048_9ACTN|nr:hypothetical protein [Streptomyces triticagri]RFU84296.1 hypothetical protein DY218_23325 [Streptomyces triticagri]
MRGDEAQLAAAAGGDDLLGSTGPRHAAPRKSLLTKLQIPTSKALALAAMPTAVFVGMGLTPKLAIADDKDAAPRAANPCVSREDEDPKDSEDPEADKDAKADKDAEAEKDAAADEDSPSPSESAKPSAGDKAGDKATPDPESTGDAGEKESEPAAGEEEPEPEPTESKTKNPLDPLGVGDAIKDFFTPDDKKTEEPAPEESAAEDEKPADESADSDDKAADDKAGDGAAAGGKAVGDAAAEAKEKAEAAKKKAAKEKAEKEKAEKEKAEEEENLSAEDKLKAKIEEAAAGAGTTAEELDGKAADENAGCAKAGDVEQGIPLLPDDPFVLETEKLTLRTLDYHGVVDVQTQSGKVKKALKFTAEEIDIKSMHQKTVGPNGLTGNVKAAEGSTTTFRNGEVTMYTEELKGNLFGLIPVTFTPETPPPLNVPFAFFTNVKVTQAGQFGGTITVPGLQNYFSRD